MDNELLDKDTNGRGTYPTLRIAGLLIIVNVEYTNTEDGLAQFPEEREVSATITLRAEKALWAGAGASFQYLTSPYTGTYTAFSAYRQGVVFEIRGTGKVYALATIYLITTLAAGLVLLSAANTIADGIAFSEVAPRWIKSMTEKMRIKKKDESVISGQAMARTKASGRIYKVKRNELISERSAQVEFGLNAAIAAAQFKMLDTDGKGHITADDLVRQLGRVGVIPESQARNVARATFDNLLHMEDEAGNRELVKIRSHIRDKTIRKGSFAGMHAKEAMAADQELDFSDFVDLMCSSAFKFEDFEDEIIKQDAKPTDVEAAAAAPAQEPPAEVEAASAESDAASVQPM